MGHLVKFSSVESDDSLAYDRLRKGFRVAKFDNCVFLEEPIAASPVHIFNQLCRWNNFIFKEKRDLNGDFHDFRYGSSDPEGNKRLYDVIRNRESFDILEGLKETKHGLTERDECVYHLDDLPIAFSLEDYLARYAYHINLSVRPA